MMKGKFLMREDLIPEKWEWGSTAGISGPMVTHAKDLVILHVTLLPGKGHDFHKHPGQEEVIYVLDGEIEQWVDKEKRILKPGDSAFITANMVHASFNIGSANAKVLAILGPAVGQSGYEVVEVSGESPWNSLRT
ncbi:MAG: cupin domain-containing protein [Saprospiraceae bacterium]|nr:cupin domain-containing protein [Saprospiraceae bacterium]